MLGRARVAELRGDLLAALDTMQEAHVKHAWFAPALIDTARLGLAVHGWQSCMEAVAKLQQLDGSNAVAFAYHSAPAPLTPLSPACPHPSCVLWSPSIAVCLVAVHSAKALIAAISCPLFTSGTNA